MLSARTGKLGSQLGAVTSLLVHVVACVYLHTLWKQWWRPCTPRSSSVGVCTACLHSCHNVRQDRAGTVDNALAKVLCHTGSLVPV